MNTSYEKLSFFNTFFSGTIDNDNIYSTDFYGNRQLIGVTQKKHQETVDLLNTYYNKLVELGIIEKEKTPEDIAKEQQQMMQAMMNEIQSMQKTIEAMKTTQSNNLDNTKIEQNNGGNNEYQSNDEFHNTKVESESRATDETDAVNGVGKNSFKFYNKPDRSC